ncbi:MULTISPECIES: hypothetical protein [unclassified Acinetobacter]|uniref:hypothetical protein n=1 Tax=unclassified Acinetobacter TaxID=196816 RepID=UPI0015D37EB5|nr:MULTISPECIES: hypothetical protein [unclassified Acinetobacter]
MAIDSKKLSDFLNKIKLEQIYNAVVIFIVALILYLATFAIYRPLTTSQFNLLLQLAEQQSLPQTQDMAQTLLQQQRIHRGQYLKLMQAYQQESLRARQLPPVSVDMP